MSDQFELPLFDPAPLAHTAEITRTFLGWDQPLLSLAVEHLTSDWRGRTLDLAHILVVVPTKQASRRLRSTLAMRASKHEAGVLPPKVVTPDYLLSAACVPDLKKGVATRAEVLVAWAHILLEANLNDFRAVFPIEPVERNFSWALRTAEEFMAVQNSLGEAGLGIQDAAKHLAAEGIEPQRWAELSRLERRTRSLLTKRRRHALQTVRSLAASQGALDPAITKIVVIGVPDPPPLFCTALRHHVAKVRCEIAIHAPEKLSRIFDDFGRPVAADWIESPIDLPDLEHRVHQAVNPDGQAQLTVDLLSTLEQPASVAAIGTPDPELYLPLEEAFAARGHATFNPAGESAAMHPLPSLLRTVFQIAQTGSFLSFLELLRVPGAVEAARLWKATPERPEFASASFLSELDTFQREHVPESLEAAAQINQSCAHSSPALTRGLSWMQGWLRRFDREKLWEVLPEFLKEIYAPSEFDPANPFDQTFTTASEFLHSTLDSLEAGQLGDDSLASTFTERLRLTLHLLENETIYSEHRHGALELQGWLELPWEDAPRLVVTGMNDGFVPESLRGDAYLPDSARRLLGLRHNEDRHARDAYLLSSLLASRRDNGQVDLIFGRRSTSEEPLRPSRLLFACPRDELAERVHLLFGSDPPARVAPPWSLTWKLTPPAPDPSLRIFERLPVTAFRDYLSCPFRFYLRRGLRMERDDPPLAELDARHFGTICHLVMEEFGADPIHQSDNEKDIAEFLDDTLHSIIRREYGEPLPVPILVQRESARQRLQWWATIEAAQRRNGWQIIESERALDTEDNPWIVNGVRITGKIDRVERHEADGLVRVLDFKTGKLKLPHDAHLRRLRRHEDPAALPTWMLCPSGNSIQRWTDLQLPLYLLAIKREDRPERIQTGYANLGRAKSEVALEVWTDLTDPLLAAAQRCMEGVIESILSRQFWPPAERVDYDDFARILLGDPLHAVDPIHLTGSP